MTVGYVLAPQATLDLVEIWRYIKEQTSLTRADRVEFAIREKNRFSGGNPRSRAPPQGFDGRGCEILPRLLLFNRLSARDETATNRLHSSRPPRRGTNT